MFGASDHVMGISSLDDFLMDSMASLKFIINLGLFLFPRPQPLSTQSLVARHSEGVEKEEMAGEPFPSYGGS